MRLDQPFRLAVATLAPQGGNSDNLTISGFSLGAYFATEMGVIWSSKFKGIGLIGGGTFGIEMRIKQNERAPEIVLYEKSLEMVEDEFKKGEIEDPANIK
jgi:predicted esterase